MKKYCIVCGNGNAPFEVLSELSSKNEVFLVLIEGVFTDKRLLNYNYKILKIGQISEFLAILAAKKINDAVFIGGVKMPNLRSVKVDFLGASLVASILKSRFMGDNSVLNVIDAFFKKKGLTIHPGHKFLKNMPIKTHNQPSKSQLLDISMGINALNHISILDVGQALAICEKKIIAIEDFNGTDSLHKTLCELFIDRRKKDNIGKIAKIKSK